jgi:hypothetical protein
VANAVKLVRFAGALTLTHNATSLILPDGLNIATAAGDSCIALSDASGNWRIFAYQRALSAFSAHKNGTAQTAIAPTTYTKVTFTTEDFDLAGDYDAANSKWTPRAGKYLLTLGLLCSAGAVDGQWITAAIYKNGSLHKEISARVGTSVGTEGVGFTCLVAANGSDYFEAYFYSTGTGDKSLSGNATDTFFQGIAIR